MSCFDVDPDTLCDVWAATWRRARRARQCFDCRVWVPPGQRYRRVATLFDGRWEDEASCERRGLRREELARAQHGREPAMGDLYDELGCVIECEPWAWSECHMRMRSGAPRDQAERLAELAAWARRVGMMVRWRFEDAGVGS